MFFFIPSFKLTLKSLAKAIAFQLSALCLMTHSTVSLSSVSIFIKYPTIHQMQRYRRLQLAHCELNHKLEIPRVTSKELDVGETLEIYHDKCYKHCGRVGFHWKTPLLRMNIFSSDWEKFHFSLCLEYLIHWFAFSSGKINECCEVGYFRPTHPQRYGNVLLMLLF